MTIGRQRITMYANLISNHKRQRQHRHALVGGMTLLLSMMLLSACGKQNVHHLEREDLVALTIEAAAMAKLPLAGTSWIPGV